MRKALLACTFVATSTVAVAQGADVGLVSLVSGEVAYLPSGGVAGGVKPFMRLREGDRVDLGRGARLRIVYFGAARQEDWQGPARFRAARGASAPVSGQPVQVTAIPAGVPQRIAGVPELIRNARLGGIQMRGGTPPVAKLTEAQRTELDDARAQYEAMRSALAADDLVPELFLFATIEGLELGFGEKPQELVALRRQVVGEMLRKQPDNAEVKSLAARMQVALRPD
jgi:hypothetical protein